MEPRSLSNPVVSSQLTISPESPESPARVTLGATTTLQAIARDQFDNLCESDPGVTVIAVASSLSDPSVDDITVTLEYSGGEQSEASGGGGGYSGALVVGKVGD